MPTYGKVHTDALINNLMTARMLKPEDAIANEVFPMVTVNRPSDKFPILNNGFLRKDDDSLGYKGVANTITWDFDTAGSFYINDYGYNTEIEGRLLRGADEPIKRKYRMLAGRVVTDKLILQKEIRAANALFSTSKFSGKTSALSGTDRLDDPSSDIFDIIGDASETVRVNCGRRPNILVLGGAVYSAIQRHPDLRESLPLDKLKGLLDASTIAEIFSNKRMKFQKILVGDTQYNTAAEGATPSFSDVWGKFLFVGYVNFEAITELDLSCTKQFVEAGREGVKVKYYKASQNEDELSEDCRAETSYDLQVIDANCGYLYSTVVS
jgi:hypothetical protein